MTLIQPAQRWYCPECHKEDVAPHPVANRYHPCAKAGGLIAPMIPAGTRAKISVNEREDYVGTETVRTDENGRPVMSIVTEREDGTNDVMVFAPVAKGGSKEV